MNTYKVGDIVVFKKERPKNWNIGGSMDQYLGKIVTIIDIGSNGRFHFLEEEEPNYWTFTLEDIESYATTEQIIKQAEEAKKFKKKIELARKKCFFEPEKIEELAASIFNEENVYLKTNNEYNFKLYIRFPEIDITNSRNEKHHIKDLYVQFDVDIRKNFFITSDFKCDIAITGRRGSLSLKEDEYGYNHSHLRLGSRGWSPFCLGTSDFSLIVEQLRLSPSKTDWTMLFLSLENYLKWESLEGGPFCQIKDIKYNKRPNKTILKEFSNDVIKNTPEHCFELSENKLKIIVEHDDFFDTIDECSPIKSLSEYSKKEIEEKIKEKNRLFKESAPFNGIDWKGNTFPINVYDSTIHQDKELLKDDVVSAYADIINTEANVFIKKLNYESAKNRNKQRVFGKI